MSDTMSKKNSYKYDGEKVTDSFGTIAWCSESSAIAIIAQFERRDKQKAELECFVRSITMLDLGHDVIGDANILIALQRKANSILSIDKRLKIQNLGHIKDS